MDATVSGAWMNLSDILRSTGRLSEAEPLVEEIVKRFPEVGAAYFQRALVHVEKNRFLPAAQDFERAASLKKDLADGWHRPAARLAHLAAPADHGGMPKRNRHREAMKAGLVAPAPMKLTTPAAPVSKPAPTGAITSGSTENAEPTNAGSRRDSSERGTRRSTSSSDRRSWRSSPRSGRRRFQPTRRNWRAARWGG